ncbi:hypothetical protein ACLBWZ_17350 [Brucellaceae bacterium C25G]
MPKLTKTILDNVDLREKSVSKVWVGRKSIGSTRRQENRMTPTEIAELFIHAAEVDRRLPQMIKLKELKAQSLGNVR